ncbi:MAG: hypothetical protein RBR47_12290 [Bacteroidales bacterium]|jgi:hypothetical protein|nr:hypothetical protein [Bacteroidales bacterium]MDD3131462.1 hypothetical protein [Bacteroidales bacterium]MDD3526835.1 hypothetical protein [Bacteroidales bacterium]MDD4177388.1 hypothetical protein [Bacteroidales bacterium]MDD4741311.1 hypothetical protein [Bacteroidales bacterium]
MYLSQIIQLLLWPLVILITYWLVRYNLKKLNKKLAEDGEEV